MKTNVNLKTIVTLTHTSPIHTVKLPYLCSARFANSPPLIILTERSTCALKTQKDSAAAPKEAWRVTWQSWSLMFSYAPGSNFQTTMVELSVAVMMVLLILQTQANIKSIKPASNSPSQPIPNTLLSAEYFQRCCYNEAPTLTSRNSCLSGLQHWLGVGSTGRTALEIWIMTEVKT